MSEITQKFLNAVQEIKKIDQCHQKIIKLLGGEIFNDDLGELKDLIEQGLIISLGGKIKDWEYIQSIYDDPFNRFYVDKLHSKEELIKELLRVINNN